LRAEGVAISKKVKTQKSKSKMTGKDKKAVSGELMTDS
jgi:hypothetical protein